MAIVAGLTLLLFISVTKNIFCLAVFLLYFFDGSCFLAPGPPLHSEAGRSSRGAGVNQKGKGSRERAISAHNKGRRLALTNDRRASIG